MHPQYASDLRCGQARDTVALRLVEIPRGAGEPTVLLTSFRPETFGSDPEPALFGAQIGMFAYTGLTAEHVAALLSDHHVYLTPDGRMAVCGLQAATVPYVAQAIDAVMRAQSRATPKL